MLKRMSVIAVFALLWAAAPVWAKQSPVVVVSIKPVHSLVSALMQGVGKPRLLVKGDKTPLDYTLSKKQAERLAASDLIIWIGPELERFLIKPLKALKGGPRVYEMLSDDQFKILLSRYRKKERDPYIWLDVRNAEFFVDQLYRALLAIDPQNKATYAENRNQLKMKIARLDREFEYGFRAIAAGEGWAYHDTQQYFAQSYALHLKGFLSLTPGKIADTERLLKARATLAGQGKTCIFTEAGLTSENLSLLTSGTGAVIAELDSFATRFKPGPQLYEDMMRFNFRTIADCYVKVGAKYTGPWAARARPKSF